MKVLWATVVRKAMSFKAASTLMVAVIAGLVKSQEDEAAIWIPRRVCAKVPFTCACPGSFAIRIRSITILSSYTNPAPKMAASNSSCLPAPANCSRTFRDASDQGFKDVPEFFSFYKWMLENCQEKQICSSTLSVPIRPKGINKICYENGVVYFVAVFLDMECVKSLFFKTSTLAPEMTNEQKQNPSPYFIASTDTFEEIDSLTRSQLDATNEVTQSPPRYGIAATGSSDNDAITIGLSITLACVTCVLFPLAVMYLHQRCRRSHQHGSPSSQDRCCHQTPVNLESVNSDPNTSSSPPVERTFSSNQQLFNNLGHNILSVRHYDDEPPPYDTACSYGSPH